MHKWSVESFEITWLRSEFVDCLCLVFIRGLLALYFNVLSLPLAVLVDAVNIWAPFRDFGNVACLLSSKSVHFPIIVRCFCNASGGISLFKEIPFIDWVMLLSEYLWFGWWLITIPCFGWSPFSFASSAVLILSALSSLLLRIAQLLAWLINSYCLVSVLRWIGSCSCSLQNHPFAWDGLTGCFYLSRTILFRLRFCRFPCHVVLKKLRKGFRPDIERQSNAIIISVCTSIWRKCKLCEYEDRCGGKWPDIAIHRRAHVISKSSRVHGHIRLWRHISNVWCGCGPGNELKQICMFMLLFFSCFWKVKVVQRESRESRYCNSIWSTFGQTVITKLFDVQFTCS